LSVALRDRARARARGGGLGRRGGARRGAGARAQVADRALDAGVPGAAAGGVRRRRARDRATPAGRRRGRVMAERHHTVGQANAALEWVRERIERLRTAREGLNDEEAREALLQAGPTNGG